MSRTFHPVIGTPEGGVMVEDDPILGHRIVIYGEGEEIWSGPIGAFSKLMAGMSVQEVETGDFRLVSKTLPRAK